MYQFESQTLFVCVGTAYTNYFCMTVTATAFQA